MDITESNSPEHENVTQRHKVLQELGDCYASVGRYERAQRCYEKAASLGPDASGPYVGLGVVALQKGLLDDAEVAFRVASRLDGNCARATAGLAMVAQEREDYERAFELYLKALEQDADNLTALLGLFQTSCRMGSFGKVIHYLELYLQTHPRDSSVMFTLAALYVKEGHLGRAEALLRDVVALDPDNADALALLEEVEQNLAGHSETGA